MKVQEDQAVYGVEAKKPVRDSLAAAAERYLKAGGKVTRLPTQIGGKTKRGPWSTHESKILRQMLHAGDSAQDIAAALNRTHQSVINKIVSQGGLRDRL